METGTKDGKEGCSFVSYETTTNPLDSEDNSLFDIAYGRIDLYITQDDETWVRYPYNFNLHIDYNDFSNTYEQKQQNLDDI